MWDVSFRSRWNIKIPCTLYLDIYLHRRLWFWVWSSWNFYNGFLLLPIQSFRFDLACKLRKLYLGPKTPSCVYNVLWTDIHLMCWILGSNLKLWIFELLHLSHCTEMGQSLASDVLQGWIKRLCWSKYSPLNCPLPLLFNTKARVVPCHYSVLTTA